MEKASVCECKQNKLQTGQNSHLAVEPAAPAVLCRKKCADYFKYGVVFFALAVVFFLFFFLHYSGALVNNLTSTINTEAAHKQPSVLCIKCWWSIAAF